MITCLDYFSVSYHCIPGLSIEIQKERKKELLMLQEPFCLVVLRLQIVISPRRLCSILERISFSSSPQLNK